MDGTFQSEAIMASNIAMRVNSEIFPSDKWGLNGIVTIAFLLIACPNVVKRSSCTCFIMTNHS